MHTAQVRRTGKEESSMDREGEGMIRRDKTGEGKVRRRGKK